MTIHEEYEQFKEQYKEKYRLVKIDGERNKYQIEFKDNKIDRWLLFFRIYENEWSFIDIIFGRKITYEEYAKKEFINQMIVLNKKVNKEVV